MWSFHGPTRLSSLILYYVHFAYTVLWMCACFFYYANPTCILSDKGYWLRQQILIHPLGISASNPVDIISACQWLWYMWVSWVEWVCVMPCVCLRVCVGGCWRYLCLTGNASTPHTCTCTCKWARCGLCQQMVIALASEVWSQITKNGAPLKNFLFTPSPMKAHALKLSV